MASCKMDAMPWVMKETSPKNRLVPMLMTMDTPMTNKRMNGSIHVEEASIRIKMHKGMTTSTMVVISLFITLFMLRFSSAAPVM